MGSGLNLDEVRSAVLEGFQRAKLRTVLRLTSGPYTLDGECDVILADLTGGAFSVLLPAAPENGDEYEFVKVDAGGNALTIDRNGKTINGAASNLSITTQWRAGARVLTWNSTQNTWIA
jgi:hypothetical protein